MPSAREVIKTTSDLKDDVLWATIKTAIATMRYGEITIQIHDGRVVQVTKTEKIRIEHQYFEPTLDRTRGEDFTSCDYVIPTGPPMVLAATPRRTFMVQLFIWRFAITTAVLFFATSLAFAKSDNDDSTAVKIPYKGFLIESENGAHQLKVGGHIQADTVFFLEDEDDLKKDEFVLRRIRPRFSGKVFNDFHYGLLIDFAGEKVTLLDAWLDYRPTPEVSLRIGKQKAPFDTEVSNPYNDLSSLAHVYRPNDPNWEKAGVTGGWLHRLHRDDPR